MTRNLIFIILWFFFKKFLSNFCQRFIKFPLKFLKLCFKISHNIFKSFLEFSKNFLLIFLKFSQNFWQLFKYIFLKIFLNFPENYLKLEVIFEISVKLSPHHPRDWFLCMLHAYVCEYNISWKQYYKLLYVFFEN